MPSVRDRSPRPVGPAGVDPHPADVSRLAEELFVFNAAAIDAEAGRRDGWPSGHADVLLEKDL